jgi:hypothetical protein
MITRRTGSLTGIVVACNQPATVYFEHTFYVRQMRWNYSFTKLRKAYFYSMTVSKTVLELNSSA